MKEAEVVVTELSELDASHRNKEWKRQLWFWLGLMAVEVVSIAVFGSNKGMLFQLAMATGFACAIASTIHGRPHSRLGKTLTALTWIVLAVAMVLFFLYIFERR